MSARHPQNPGIVIYTPEKGDPMRLYLILGMIVSPLVLLQVSPVAAGEGTEMFSYAKRGVEHWSVQSNGNTAKEIHIAQAMQECPEGSGKYCPVGTRCVYYCPSEGGREACRYVCRK